MQPYVKQNGGAGMEKLDREEVRDLTDMEVTLALERIKRDRSFGLLNDRITPAENVQVLEEELRDRGRQALS
jgi:hypothetical protein